MPRKPRIEFEGALYHMMEHANRLQVVFRDDEDRHIFLKTHGQCCERTGWRVHSYVWK